MGLMIPFQGCKMSPVAVGRCRVDSGSGHPRFGQRACEAAPVGRPEFMKMVNLDRSKHETMGMRAAGPGGIVAFLAAAFLAISGIVGQGLSRTSAARNGSSVHAHGARDKDSGVIRKNFQSGKYARKEAWFYQQVSGSHDGRGDAQDGPRHGHDGRGRPVFANPTRSGNGR